MSLPSQVEKTGKHRAAAMKEADVYFGMGPPTIDSHSDVSAGMSGVASQNLGHYQQQPVKWMHQEAMQQGSGWSQDTPLTGWGQNFPYIGGNIRGQVFHKNAHDSLQMGGEVYRDNSQQVQWDPMHQLQAYQQQPQPQPQPQPHQATHTLQGPMLQPFQTFRANKPQQQQQFSAGYYPGFSQNKALPSLAYSEQQGKATQQPQQPLLHQIQQQQQQQLHHQQHMQQHQIQRQQQMQQQQLRQQQMQLQQHYHMQERHMVKPVPQELPQQAMQVAAPSKPQSFAGYHGPEPPPSHPVVIKDENLETQNQEMGEEREKAALSMVEVKSGAQAQPRRSRRLSRDGPSPTTEGKENGVGQTTGGVIQSTRRKRRASKEINLETLAQQASKRESLPDKAKEDSSSGRQSSMAPLVMPVSVPVPRLTQDPQGGWSQDRPGTGDRSGVHTDHKPSVIVARRRSLRNSITDSFVQDGENDSGTDDDSKPKPKRRPRPEPLIIPPPRPSTFIPPSVYSSITSYQSNLRSPIRTMDNPLVLPPYTPPPILSPVRGGSGLYFSTFLSNMAAAGNQILPASMTPKLVSVSLQRLAVSTESTPPLTIVTDATPVSLEPRINIGQQYQAEIPDLVSPSSLPLDHHKADLVWLPIDGLKHGGQDNVDNLMNMASSSVFRGGGTNQELVLHCLYECGGDLMKTLGRLMLQDIVFPKGHPLSNYHYSGSDNWTPEEKRYFNKGISAYRKDFFMVQKLVQTKTVAQCVEFYYTYKKQVKVGRNGVITFGPPDSPGDKHNEAVVDVKSSQQPRAPPGEAEEDKDNKDVSSSEQNHQARVAQSLQAHDYAATVLVVKESDLVKADSPKPPAAPRSRAEPKKGKAPPKPPQDPNAVFPCKKCGRVFSKVKSRSAHMKSHSEQEKKAAALRQKQEEEEEQARARRAALVLASAGIHRTEDLNQDPDQDPDGQDSTEGEDDDDEDWH